MAVRAVLGQQITVKAAGTLAARLVVAYGPPLATAINGLTHTFPSPNDILSLKPPIEDRLGVLGITAARARTILVLAQSFADGSVDLTDSAVPADQMMCLMALPGIGRWTANYIVMRTMAWTDAFLETDHGIRRALAPRTSKEILSLAEAWRPWRSYAVVSIWNSLK
jgi:AraC family transcriptional regulator of adaptative response / DNA-3-methyladenine glycosylase II